MKTLVIFTVVVFFYSPFLHAGYFSLLNGRSAELAEKDSISVQTGLVKGDLYDLDYEHLGVRVGYSVSDQLEVFGEIGRVGLAKSGKATALGFGALYTIPNQFDWVKHSVIRASIDRANLPTNSTVQTGATTTLVCDSFGSCFGVDVNAVTGTTSRGGTSTNISAEWLVSGEPLSTFNLNGSPVSWYANVGLQNLKNVNDSKTKLGFGVGLLVTTNSGEIHLGFDRIDGMIYGLGYRHFIR